MTIERAMEILDPEHREHYESIDPVKEACRMGMMALDVVKRIVLCKDCSRCFDLDGKDPMTPYSGKGDGSFYCSAWDMDLHAPHYHADTYFCADGKRREDDNG